MTPLFYAVYHGCQAAKHQEACDGVYHDRILRGRNFYLWTELGAFGIDLSVLSNFFVTPWAKPVLTLRAASQAWLMNCTAFALRSLGRLTEALEPMQAGADADANREDWKNATTSLCNLSGLHLTLGNVRESIDAGRLSVEAATRDGDAFYLLAAKTTLAEMLHQSGDSAEAAQLFAEAESTHAPEGHILHSVAGYQLCELLLAQHREDEVLRRATRTLPWHEQNGWLLDIALDHLSLGRANFPGSAEAIDHLNQAVSGLRRACRFDYIPLGLLARAAHFRHTSDFNKAQHDLGEVRILATRCGMRLHLADYHLEQARLFLAQQKPEDATPHYECARSLVEETGYHRRDPELAELETQLGIEQASA